MTTETALALRPSGEVAPMSADAVRRQIQVIQQVMAEAMKEGEHYGTIPGCGKKNTLFKSGSEKLCLTFRLRPEYDIKRTDMANGHREYEVVTNLFHIGSGDLLGQGVGNCSTMESKYRFRLMGRTCPKCGAETIIKGKEEYGGGWICLAGKGGCGQKFKKGDKEIEEQVVGRAEYDNPADYYNTVMKMAKKRSLVDGTIQVLAASDIFAQDLEDEVNQEHRKVEEELKGGKSGPKNPEKLQDYTSTALAFTEAVSLKAWRATNDAKIKTDLSGQGELFSFNARYTEHLAELEKTTGKTFAEYAAEINGLSIEQELNDYWKATNIQAKQDLQGDFEKYKAAWVDRKKALIEAASQPPEDEPEPAETKTNSGGQSEMMRKMLAGKEFAGEEVFRKALASLDIEADTDINKLPDHLCKLLIAEMNTLADGGS